MKRGMFILPLFLGGMLERNYYNIGGELERTQLRVFSFIEIEAL